MYEPDPLSLWLERGARVQLGRAWAKRGEWVYTRLADPPADQRRRIQARYGIDPLGPDTVPQGRAKTRWGRAFIRALNRINKDSRGPALQVEVGSHKPGGRQEGTLLVAGRAVRVRYPRGGAAAVMKAVARTPARQRIYDEDGAPGPRWADPADRDW